MTRHLILTLLAVSLGACGDDSSPDTGPVDAGSDADAADAADAADMGPACTFEEEAPMLPDPARYTPRWAFEPWISKDISDRADTEAFVAGFLDRDIPVGAVVLDSPWETNYNTLIPNPERYGDFQSLIDDLHGQDIRLVLWTTQMVNRLSFDVETGGDSYREPAENLREGLDCDFFINEGKLYFWWKGNGAAIDFFDPGARAWWRRQQDDLYAMGIDGWKLDFGESYIRDRDLNDDPIQTFEGEKTLQEYSEAYYADMLAYGVQERGREFVTMVRGFDVSYNLRPRFYARPEHAPVVWMGDNHRNFEGLIDALDHTFRSANAGYVVIGSDIGGYLDRDENMLLTEIPFDQESFARWVGWSGMMPFFQLHGRANLEPWNIPERTEETVRLYRYWATLHHEMVPFWFSLAQRAYAGEGELLQPIGEEADWAGDWRYLIGDAFLIAPILEAGGVRDIELPEGRFFDWWSGEVHDGPSTLEAYSGATSRERIPVFAREGAIVPMEIDSEVTGIGNSAAEGLLTVLAWLPRAGESQFVLHREDDTTATFVASARSVAIEGGREALLLRLRLAPEEAPPAILEVDGSTVPALADRATLDAASEGWAMDGDFLWVKLAAVDGDRTLSIAP